MKDHVKELIRRNIGRLPWGMRQAALDGLLKRTGHRQVLEQLAEHEGIATFGCDGEFGHVISSRADHAVLGRYAKTGTFAQGSQDFFGSFFGTGGGTYLDIGANIGLTTLGIARNKLITCIAFEPDPTNFRHLTDNVRRNAIHDNVILHEVALFHSTTKLTFALSSDGNLGDHRIANPLEQRRTIEVTGVRLDDVVTLVSHPIAAKIDVQGAEPFVIAGGPATLRQVDALTIEFSPYHMALLDADGEVVIDYLSQFDQLACVRGDSNEPLDFGDPAFVRDRLKRALKDWRDEEYLYLDVYARR